MTEHLKNNGLHIVNNIRFIIVYLYCYYNHYSSTELDIIIFISGAVKLNGMSQRIFRIQKLINIEKNSTIPLIRFIRILYGVHFSSSLYMFSIIIVINVFFFL